MERFTVASWMYHLQADRLLRMTIPLRPFRPPRTHVPKTSFPPHLPAQTADARLGLDLEEQPEPRLDYRALRAKACRPHGPPHQFVIDHNVRAHLILRHHACAQNSPCVWINQAEGMLPGKARRNRGLTGMSRGFRARIDWRDRGDPSPEANEVAIANRCQLPHADRDFDVPTKHSRPTATALRT